MSTIRDVAKLAGVSVATVSRVINRAANVSHEKTSTVLSAISSLQYQPNVSAAQLSRNGGVPKRRKQLGSSSNRKRAVIDNVQANEQNELNRIDRVRALEEENSRLKATIAKMDRELEYYWR